MTPGKLPTPSGRRLEHLVPGRQHMTRVVLALGVAELGERRAEVGAPVGLGHRNGADRVQGPAGGTDPVVDRPVGRHQSSCVDRAVGGREPEQVERGALRIRWQPQQRGLDRPPEDRGDHDLPQRAQVGRWQLGQLAGDQRLDRGLPDEGGQPRVRERPLAVGAQQLLQGGEPGEVVEVGQGARLRLRSVVGQAGEQGGVVGRGPGERLDDVEAVRPAAGRGGQDRALQPLEPVVAQEQAQVASIVVRSG